MYIHIYIFIYLFTAINYKLYECMYVRKTVARVKPRSCINYE